LRNPSSPEKLLSRNPIYSPLMLRRFPENQPMIIQGAGKSGSMSPLDVWPVMSQIIVKNNTREDQG
jgi:hypothetical protein